jgi:hypothetical protein
MSWWFVVIVIGLCWLFIGLSAVNKRRRQEDLERWQQQATHWYPTDKDYES